LIILSVSEGPLHRLQQEGYSIMIALRPWSDDDLPLLERLMGDPVMTEHLGGPETPDKIRDRHARYVELTRQAGNSRMLVIEVGEDRVPAGSIGYWEKEWLGHQVLETGWGVLPEFQGKGIATSATIALVEHLCTAGIQGEVHAYPSVDNPASNAICRKAGFTFRGEYDFEYPPGNAIHCNDWSIDLSSRCDATRFRTTQA
jgi:RimJ/RimL family protein N-acetyltransferase